MGTQGTEKRRHRCPVGTASDSVEHHIGVSIETAVLIVHLLKLHGCIARRYQSPSVGADTCIQPHEKG